MWPFDYFKKKREEEEQELRRQEECRRKERERQNRLKTEREQAGTMQPFTFKSNCHQRYENGSPVMGLQQCIRTVSVVKNTNGCPGYKLAHGIGYIVKIYNDDLSKPNMSDKPMKVVRKTETSVKLRGFPIEAQSPFGWQEVDYSDYGFIVYYKNGKVDKCVLHMYDRNIRLEYMSSNNTKENKPKNENEHFNNSVAIGAVAKGTVFNLRFSKVQVLKQPDNGKAIEIATDKTAYARIVRKEANGIVIFDISNIAELSSKGIIQNNPSFNPQFTYAKQGDDYEAASAEINNSWMAVNSNKEFISLFQITKQGGKLIAFVINNIPNAEDYYYLIIFS